MIDGNYNASEREMRQIAVGRIIFRALQEFNVPAKDAEALLRMELRFLLFFLEHAERISDSEATEKMMQFLREENLLVSASGQRN